MRRKPGIFPAMVLLPLLFTACGSEEPERPNFVIIQLDDLGFDDLGIHGNRFVESPNIDSIALLSMQFDQFYVNPVCAPTRASLLTGRHFLKTGVSHVHGGKDFLNLDESTFADLLSDAGYATGMWGKWHSGHAPGYYPWERGFDEAYMAQLYKHRESEGDFNGKHVKHSAWADQVITDYAIDFMDRHRGDPFLAYLSFLSVHSPLDTPDSLRQKYIAKGLSPDLATLYGMVEHTDHHIGRFFHALDTMDLDDHTVVMIMSDNGPAVLNDLLSDRDREIRYVSRMKGHKGNVWENGVRSPLFIKWQGVTRPMINYSLVDVTDVFPTLLELAGVELPEDNKPIDGVPFCEVITCGFMDTLDKVSFNYANRGWPPTSEPWTPEGVLDEYRPVTPSSKTDEQYEEQIISVRKGAFKLMQNPGSLKGEPERSGRYVLIDILADPEEKNNLYNEMPGIAADLEELLRSWWSDILEEAGSFAMPVFRVGDGQDSPDVIPAKAPFSTSDGVKSTFAWLTNWTVPGDFATYSLDVDRRGLYEVTLRYSGAPGGALLKVSSAIDSITAPAVLPDHAILGSIEMDKGRQLLRLELIENPSGGTIFDQLTAIELQRK